MVLCHRNIHRCFKVYLTFFSKPCYYIYIISVEAFSLFSLLCGVAPDIITFSLMNIQIYLAMKGDFNMRDNSFGVVLTCVCGVV